MTPDSLLKNDSLWERELFLLTTEFSGRPPPLCRGQTRPTMPHGPLERVVRRHCFHLSLCPKPRHDYRHLATSVTSRNEMTDTQRNHGPAPKPSGTVRG